MAKGRHHDEEKKLAVVLEGLKGEASIAEICRKHGISDTLYYKWRDQFVEAGKRGLSRRQESPSAEMKRKLAEYERVVGRLSIENQILKKTLEL